MTRPDPFPSIGTTPYAKSRVTLTLSMLTTLSLSLSTAPVIWFSRDVRIDTVLEPPARLSDRLDPDVQIVSLLSRFCFSSYFDASRNPSGGGVNIVHEQSYPASWRYVLKSFTILEVPTAKVEVRTVKLERHRHHMRLHVRANEGESPNTSLHKIPKLLLGEGCPGRSPHPLSHHIL